MDGCRRGEKKRGLAEGEVKEREGESGGFGNEKGQQM